MALLLIIVHTILALAYIVVLAAGIILYKFQAVYADLLYGSTGNIPPIFLMLTGTLMMITHIIALPVGNNAHYLH